VSERRISHVIGIDDAPFRREQRGDVLVVGAVFAGLRLDGVLSTRVRRDGKNATSKLAAMIRGSQFYAQLHAILLQGIALAGFNVVDIHGLCAELARPVVVIARKAPDLPAIRRALESRVSGGAAKWRLIERAGAMEPVGAVHVQRAGIGRAAAEALIQRLSVHGNIPEPLRFAHLIAGGVTTGRSRGRT
jgi:uncharacterized protein